MFTFFYSDPHFGHRRMADSRGFTDIDAHDAGLIERFCATVGDDDVVCWLGDVSFRNATRTAEIIHRLPGTHVLIPGNHDWGRSDQWFYRAGFSMVLPRQVAYRMAERPVLLSHLPYDDVEHVAGLDTRFASQRPQRLKGQILVHGHTHSPIRAQRGAIHVGCDAWGLKPVSSETIAGLVAEA